MLQRAIPRLLCPYVDAGLRKKMPRCAQKKKQIKPAFHFRSWSSVIIHFLDVCAGSSVDMGQRVLVSPDVFNGVLSYGYIPDGAGIYFSNFHFWEDPCLPPMTAAIGRDYYPLIKY